MTNTTKELLEDLITKTKVLTLIIAKDPAGMNARAYLDASDALLSLKLVQVELSNDT